jgi:hypothetical protein
MLFHRSRRTAISRLLSLLLSAVGKGADRPFPRWLTNAAAAGFPVAQNCMSFAGIKSGVFGVAGAPVQPRVHGKETRPAIAIAPMPCFRFIREVTGTWILTGAASQPAVHFSDLAVAISSAREDASAAEADIELWADGFYVFVHQTKGWPHRICAPAKRTANRQMKRR